MATVERGRYHPPWVMLPSSGHVVVQVEAATAQNDGDRPFDPSARQRGTMSPIDFYSTQLRVLWEWRGGPRALVKRLLITLVVSAIAFMATAWLLPSITVDRILDGVIVVILMALLNAVIRPVVLAFVAPRSLILTGIAVLLLQVLIFFGAANLVPGVHVASFLTALIGSFIYAAINTALTAILGVDTGDSFYGLLIQNLLIKRAGPKTDQPGLVIIQIDGLAYPILAGRIRAGSVNTHGRLGP